jgi:hypothetical protein
MRTLAIAPPRAHLAGCRAVGSQQIGVEKTTPWSFTGNGWGHSVEPKPSAPLGRDDDDEQLCREQLEADDSLCLQALGTLLDFEFHGLALIQALVPVRLDCGEVNEYVFTRLSLDEPIALGCIEPLDCTLLSGHFCCS